MPDIILLTRCAYPGVGTEYSEEDVQQIPRSTVRYGAIGLTREQQGFEEVEE